MVPAKDCHRLLMNFMKISFCIFTFVQEEGKQKGKGNQEKKRRKEIKKRKERIQRTWRTYLLCVWRSNFLCKGCMILSPQHLPSLVGMC